VSDSSLLASGGAAEAFARAAVRDEQDLGALLDDLDAEEKKDRALVALDAEWHRAIASGSIDATEARTLGNLFLEAGVEAPPAIAALKPGDAIRGADLDRLDQSVEASVADGRSTASNAEVDLKIGSNYLASEIQNNWGNASNVLKIENDTYMNTIKNLIA
jgi:hypothetical protein